MLDVSPEDVGVEEVDSTGLVLENPLVVRVELTEPVPEELGPLMDGVLLPPVEVELDQVYELCVVVELELSVPLVIVLVETVPVLCELVGVVLTPLVVVLLP